MSKVDEIFKKATKEFGTDSVRMANDTVEIEAVSSGIPSLDYALGIGGYPKGGITMIFGPESVGKSAMAYLAIAEAQKNGLNAAFIDLEGSFDKNFAAHFGVDTENLPIFNPTSAEDTSKQAVWLASEPSVGITVVDSIGAMASEKELDEDGKKQAYGQSGIITQMVKQLLPRIAQTKQVFLLLNQVRDTANRQGLPIVHAPGGHALHHSCGVIIQMKRGGTAGIKKAKVSGEIDPVEIGFRPIATITKSKVGPPKRNAEWDFYHTPTETNDVGIDVIESTVSVALRTGLIQQRGAWYDLWDKSFQGRTALVDWLKEDPELIDKVRAELFVGAVNAGE
jgi:recombination protein RecA